jgi:hypothetical protein
MKGVASGDIPCSPFGLSKSLAFALFLMFTQAAIACSPAPRPVEYVKPSLSEFAERNFANATYVAEIKILSIAERKKPWDESIRFQVKKQYKGKLPATGSFVFGRDACDHMFESFREGETTVVFLSHQLNSIYERDPYLPYVKSDVEAYVRKTKRSGETK